MTDYSARSRAEIALNLVSQSYAQLCLKALRQKDEEGGNFKLIVPKDYCNFGTIPAGTTLYDADLRFSEHNIGYTFCVVIYIILLC